MLSCQTDIKVLISFLFIVQETGQPAESDLLNITRPDYSGDKKCVAVNKTTGLWSLQHCSSKYLFYCQHEETVRHERESDLVSFRTQLGFSLYFIRDFPHKGFCTRDWNFALFFVFLGYQVNVSARWRVQVQFWVRFWRRNCN